MAKKKPAPAPTPDPSPQEDVTDEQIYDKYPEAAGKFVDTDADFWDWGRRPGDKEGKAEDAAEGGVEE
jgi:hypothetical protein